MSTPDFENSTTPEVGTPDAGTPSAGTSDAGGSVDETQVTRGPYADAGSVAPPPAAPQYGQPAGQFPGQPAAGAHAPQAGLSPSDESLWAGGAHWGALVLWVVTGGFLGFLAPLVVMQAKGDQSPRVRQNAVSSLNFQLSVLIYAAVTAVVLIIGFVLSFIIVGIPILIVGVVMLLVIAALAVIFPIIAALKTANGEQASYPLTITIVK